MQKIVLAECVQCRHCSRMTATANAITPKVQIENEWTGKDGRKFRSFRYWMNEGWSQSFLQEFTEVTGWRTLY